MRSALSREGRLEAHVAARSSANEQFFAAEAERTARLCHRMAERFARGGRLIALAGTPSARSDARHVAVEFVHPVIVGKRALPAIALAAEGGSLARQLDLLAEAEDIVIAFDAEGAATLGAASARGCLTIALGVPSGEAAWCMVPPTGDPFVAQELVETLYHVLWELVHVFFDHRGLLEGRSERRVHDSGASSFLYPFLAEQEHDLESVVDDVRSSVLAKAQDIGALRVQTLSDGAEPLFEAAATLGRSFSGGGRLLVLGNGGSATDAMDLAADMRDPPAGAGLHAAGARWPPRPVIDLTEDTPIITAVANDIGTDAIFSRQVIAYGRPGDVLVALSTSGNSASVVRALEQARRGELRTVALLGYDGGRVAAEQLADHLVVARSEHIPRIQEAHASAYHVLRELVEIV
jgi:D-sedoheptulose 7-phosphate isomerase